MLPVLSAQQPIADVRTGLPTSQFNRFVDELRAGIIASDASLADTIADLQVQVDRLTAILAGTGEPFTGLKVGSQNVKPFLDRTDGSKITNVAALNDGLVSTVKVAANAITAEATAFTAATQAQTAATETDVQTVNYTTTGETIEVRANFFLTVWHPTAGGIDATVRIYRDTTVIYSQTFTAINGDLLQGWQTPIVIEDPAAGTYTFKVTVQCSNAGWATAETSSRLLAVREFKR